jgi:hypothetical protein
MATNRTFQWITDSRLSQTASKGLKYVTAEAALRAPRMSRKVEDSEVVVSLTTYPGRINIVWKTLETLFRQSVRPSRIVLALSVDEFPGQVIPQVLDAYVADGLQIVFAEGNTRSYKKLLPALDLYPSNAIVTADDDILYPHRWLEKLVEAHRQRPHHIIGHRGTVILKQGEGVAPYLEWPQADSRTPTNRVFLTGSGGILYPPKSLPNMVFDTDTAQRLCPTADDIWFKAMSLMAGTPLSKVSDWQGDFVTVREAQKSSLRELNVAQGRNDEQFDNVMNHLSLWKYL